jgi:SAM-dependent methyltransferase
MNDFRSASLQSWSSVAADWGELIANVDRQLARAVEWMIRAAEPAPGDRVLELAGGPGTVSLAAAQLVGEEGEVICTDFAEPMVQVALRRIAEVGVQNINCHVMDAEAIDLPDADIDVVLCRMGFMLMADPEQALRESARVLRGGGRLALAVWSDAAANPWASVPMRVISDHLNAPPPPPDAPGLWALADERRLRSMLVAAGFDSVTTEVLDDHVMYDSVGAWVQGIARLAGPLRALFDNLDERGRSAILTAVEAAADPFRQDDGTVAVPERMLAASGVKPASAEA